MESPQWNPSVEHTIDKAHDSLFVIICREGSGQPQSKGPWCGKSRFSGNIRVPPQHIFHLRTIDQEVVEISALHGEFRSCDHLCANLKLNVFRMVYKDTITLA